MRVAVARLSAAQAPNKAIPPRRSASGICQPPHGQPAPGWTAGERAAAAPVHRRAASRVLARHGKDYDQDYVEFDDEEDWEQTGTSIQSPGLTPVLNTAMRGLAAVVDRLTDVALQFAPADASPGVVRIAVSAGMVLMALSFVKSILSFFLTLGSIVLGAYVAVRVFGLDVPGVPGAVGGGSGSGSSNRIERPRAAAKRQPDSRARQSEFKGLLGSRGSEEESGLLDVWFERKSGGGKDSGKKGTGGKAGERWRR